MEGYTANERRQSDQDAPRYAVDGGRIYAVNNSGNPAVNNQQSQNMGASMHSAPAGTLNYRYTAIPQSVQVAQQVPAASEHQRRRTSYPSGADPIHQPQYANVSIPPNWGAPPLSAPPQMQVFTTMQHNPFPLQTFAEAGPSMLPPPGDMHAHQRRVSSGAESSSFSAQRQSGSGHRSSSISSMQSHPSAPPHAGPSGIRPRSLTSGGHPHTYPAIAPAPPPLPSQIHAAPAPPHHPTSTPNSGNNRIASTSASASASTSTSTHQVSSSAAALASEAEAALLPVRGALEGLWGLISSSHTTALAKERSQHMKCAKALQAERAANARLREELQTEKDLRLAAKTAVDAASSSSDSAHGGPSGSAEAERISTILNAAFEEGRRRGRKDARGELNAQQLEHETALMHKETRIRQLQSEMERLRGALRNSDNAVAMGDRNVIKLLLEIPPTREEAVELQSDQDIARMGAVIKSVGDVHVQRQERTAERRKVRKTVKSLNKDLYTLVENWAIRGEDVQLSSRWKKAWTRAAVNGQQRLHRLALGRHLRPDATNAVRAFGTSASRPQSTGPSSSSVLAPSNNGHASASASPSIFSVISRKVSTASSSTSISTPPPPSSALSINTAIPDTGSSRATPIDIDLDDHSPSKHPTPASMTLTSASKLPFLAQAQEQRSLLEVIAEARQQFSLQKTKPSPPDSLEPAPPPPPPSAPPTQATQSYRSAYGLSALPPTPRDFYDPDPDDPDYDAHSVPRLSPPRSIRDSENPPSATMSEWEQRGWQLRTPPPASAAVSPDTPEKELPAHEHVPSSPCLLRDVMPLQRVAPAAKHEHEQPHAAAAEEEERGRDGSPMLVDDANPSVAPLCLGAVNVSPEISEEGPSATGKRSRAEFEASQGVHPDEGDSEERKRRAAAPGRPSPPIRTKPEPMDVVLDQTADLSLDGTPAPEGEKEKQEVDEMEGDGDDTDTTAVETKREHIDDHEGMDVAEPVKAAPGPVPQPPTMHVTVSQTSEEGEIRASVAPRAPVFKLALPTSTSNDLEEGEITPSSTPVREEASESRPPPPSRLSSANTTAPSAACFTRKDRPLPPMIRRTKPMDPPPPTTPQKHDLAPSNTPSQRNSYRPSPPGGRKLERATYERDGGRRDSGPLPSHSPSRARPTSPTRRPSRPSSPTRRPSRPSSPTRRPSRPSPPTHRPPPAAARPANHARPSHPKPTKLGISHMEILFRSQGKDLELVCRMCETRLRDDIAKAPGGPRRSVSRFPKDAAWDTLIGHCRREHPVACEELERKKPSDIAELSQRMRGPRPSR